MHRTFEGVNEENPRAEGALENFGIFDEKINILADFLSKFTTLRALPLPFRVCPTPAYRSPALLPPDPCVPLRPLAAYPRGDCPPPCHSMVIITVKILKFRSLIFFSSLMGELTIGRTDTGAICPPLGELTIGRIA